jgi:myosin heavy subunit
MVMDQLNCAGLLEVCRIRQMGYPIRKGFKEFLFEYKPIAPKAKDHKDLAAMLEKKKILTGKDWQFGKSQVFLRVSQFTKLEAEREKALSKVIVKMQKVARGFIVRRRVRQLMKVLADIKKATKDRDFDKLSAALLQTGALPRNGRHLPVVIAGTKVLDALKVEKQVLGTLEEAIEGRDKNALETAIKTATSLKVSACFVCLAS